MGKRQKAEPQPGTLPFQQPGDMTLISKAVLRECRKLPREKTLEKLKCFWEADGLFCKLALFFCLFVLISFPFSNVDHIKFRKHNSFLYYCFYLLFKLFHFRFLSVESVRWENCITVTKNNCVWVWK